MGNNKRKQPQATPQKNSLGKDVFDVKENLKKLRSGSDSYSTDFNSNDNSISNLNSETSSSSITGSPIYTDKLDLLRDRLTSDLSLIKQNLDDHKDKINERFNGDITQLRREINNQSEKFDEKLSKFVTKEWLAGIIAAVLIIVGIIYTLSYSEVLADVKDLKEKQNECDKKIEKVSGEIENTNLKTNTQRKVESNSNPSK